jgi:protein-S-isoprenylcysteine O-methyltransferase Ste14
LESAERNRGGREGTEFPHSHLLQIVCVTLFMIVWCSDSFNLNFSTFLGDFVPSEIRAAVALILIVVGFGVSWQGHWLLFGKKLWPRLVTTGVFAYVRHPIYLGFILFYLGFVVGTMSLLSIIPWLLVVRLYVSMANFEERKLEERFGEEYLEYERRVPKWIPRWK